MKRYCRIPAFEQFEAKRPLAADVCEHEGEESVPVVESSSLGAEESEGLLFRAPAALQFATSINEAQALSSEEEDEDEEENGQETDDEEEETDDNDEESDESDDEEDDTEEEDESDEEDDSEDDDEDEDDESNEDETEDNDDESDDLDEDETDDEDTDESDEDDDEEDDSDGDEVDEDDEGETLLTANLTGTGSGTAEFESEMEGGGTERELTIEVMGTTPGMHEVKINSTAVGNIVVSSDGTGTLELSSDPDDDEMQLPDGVTIAGGTTVMVGNVLMGTFPASLTAVMAPSATSAAPAVDKTSLAASYSEPVVAASAASPSAESVVFHAQSADAALADLLLTIANLSEDDELESTEFVGRSDGRDATADADVAAHDVAIGGKDE